MSALKSESDKKIKKIFQDARHSLLVIHQRKLDLINSLRKADDASQAEEILHKIKDLK